MQIRFLAMALVVALPLPLGAQSASPRASLIEADKAAGTAVFQRGLQTALQDMLAEDAVLVFEGAPLLSGRGRIIQIFASQPDLARLRIQRMPVLAAISNDGNYGATTGASIITRRGQPPDSARAMAITSSSGAGRVRPTPGGSWPSWKTD